MVDGVHRVRHHHRRERRGQRVGPDQREQQRDAKAQLECTKIMQKVLVGGELDDLGERSRIHQTPDADSEGEHTRQSGNRHHDQPRDRVWIFPHAG
ncbi:hypothetical protein [Mycobacterium asiaticum]|uniref:hypothetical protein n=1 Tax=Mycobacterium asiaticum TaxID=1790 RepID=UPI0007EF819B|nr:hypothetical protein [Mycobacterium asiaticum]OBI93113.1 hypothetical protein A5661_24465 [Mycobacterium asiaticum]